VSTYPGVDDVDLKKNPELSCRTAIIRSFDNGRTWDNGLIRPPSPFVSDETNGPMVLRDGTLVCLHGSYEPDHPGLRVIFSTDSGHTWIAPAKNYGFLVSNCYGYAKAMELPDGSLFVTDQDKGGHTTHDAQNMSIRCLILKIRTDHSGIELLPAPR
jgi:hypothetical protein